MFHQESHEKSGKNMTIEILENTPTLTNLSARKNLTSSDYF